MDLVPGDSKERSDIDLAILCPTATLSQWQQVVDIIQNADTLLKIDYVHWEDLDLLEFLYEQILQDKIILFTRKEKMKVAWGTEL